MRTINLSLLALIGTLFGCGDDPQPDPQSPPALLSGAEAVCEVRKQKGANQTSLKVLSLKSVQFSVEDLDGVDDLEHPRVRIGGVDIEMGPPEKLGAAVPEECLSEDGQCQARFSWVRGADDGMTPAGPGVGLGDILCGTGSDDMTFDPVPFVSVQLIDRRGWKDEGAFKVTIAQ